MTSRRPVGRALLLALVGCVLGACSTHRLPVSYASTRAYDAADATGSAVTVGRFADARDTDSDWLGAIRGGYGNVLKRLRTEKPTHEVVEDAFADALEEHDLYAPRGEARYELAGRILKLDCSYYVNREAHAHLEVRLVDLADAEVLHDDVYYADLTEPGVGAGIFGSVEGLRDLAARTLSVAVDQVLSDPAFLRALEEPAAPEQDELAERLRALETLRSRGLVSDEEYEQKRREILDAL